MTEVRPFGWADLLRLLFVLAVAGGLRAGYLWQYADRGHEPGPYRVQDLPANEVEATFSGPPQEPLDSEGLHTSPGYRLALQWLARAVGSQDPAQLRSWVLWIQCGLGTASAGLYLLFARRAFRSRALGVLTGLAVAAWPFGILATGEVGDGVLTAFALAAVLFLGARAGQTAGPFAALLFGLALAGLSLVRAACLPFAFVALVWFLLRCRSLPRGWLCAVLAFLGFANGLAPWLVHAAQLQGGPVPVVDSTYLHLWIGNNPTATGGPAAAGTQPPDDERLLAQAVVEQWRADPVGGMRRRLHAGLAFLLGEQFFTQHRLAEPTPGRELPGVDETLLATLLAVLALAFVGWRWSYAWRRESLPAALAVFWLPLPYLLSHAEGLHGPRLPLDGLLLCYAVCALVGLIPGLGRALREGPEPAERAGPTAVPGTRPLPAPVGPAPPLTRRGPSWR